MISVNGVDLRSLGFTASGRPRLPRLGGERSAVQPIPGTVGAVRLGASGEAGTLTVRGMISGADHEQLLERLDALAALLQGQCVIRLSDYPDREWHGLLQRGPTTPIGPAWITRVEDVTLEWLLPDPTAIAREATILGGPEATLTLGTAPCPIAVDVLASYGGPVTRVIVQVMRGAEVLRSLQWDGEVPLGSTWTVDDESHSVTVSGANAIDGLTAASEFPEASPTERADRVVVQTVGGDAQIIVRYFRRWY